MSKEGTAKMAMEMLVLVVSSFFVTICSKKLEIFSIAYYNYTNCIYVYEKGAKK